MKSLINRGTAALFRHFYRQMHQRAWGGNVAEQVQVSQLQVPVRTEYRPTRMYHGRGDQPLIIYFHGGGFVIGCLDTHDPFCRALCATSKCTVMSVDYRLAPEHPCPCAHDDAVQVSQWIIAESSSLAPNNGRIVLAGDSAGGNLAVATALALDVSPYVVGCITYWPWLQHYHSALPSRSEHARSKPLTQSILKWFSDTYLGMAPAAREVERVFPGKGANFRGFPRALVMTAERDPLRDDGRRFAQYLKQRGNDVTYKHFSEEAHGFGCSEGPTPGHMSCLALTCQWLDHFSSHE